MEVHVFVIFLHNYVIAVSSPICTQLIFCKYSYTPANEVWQNAVSPCLSTRHFLAHLHFSAEELLLYPGVRVRVGVRMQHDRANAYVNTSLGILVFLYFFLHVNFIILVKPLRSKTYDRRASVLV